MCRPISASAWASPAPLLGTQFIDGARAFLHGKPGESSVEFDRVIYHRAQLRPRFRKQLGVSGKSI